MRTHPILGLTAFSMLLVLPSSASRADSSAELALAEKTLAEAKIAADGPSLIKFFQERTLSPAQRKSLADLVPRLGDDEFSARETAYSQLRIAGRAALPFLKPALLSSDPEIAGRAARLVREVEAGVEAAVTCAAAHVLAARKPPGAVAALLAYLPMTDDESVEQAVLSALAHLGISKGKVAPDLTAALKDGDPVRRMAAAFVHGQDGPEPRKALYALLADADARVRFHAAAGLAHSGEKRAVPVLIEGLKDAPPSVAARAEGLLLRIAGAGAPETTLGSTADERADCRSAWAAWWKTNEAKIDLAKVNFAESERGLTLISDVDLVGGGGGRLWEVGPDGKERWHYNGVRVITDAHILPGQRMLLAEGANFQVTERDRQGKVLWSHRTNGYATTALRLPNGNTLIAGYNEIQEVTPKRNVVFTQPARGGSIFRVKRLRNGNLLFPSNGQVVEIDRAGKQVRTINVPGGTGIWAHVELLSTGRYLVAQYSANKVIELDGTGKVHWEVSVTTPSSASRLANGNTLVSSMDARRIVVFNKAGKEVWSLKTQGRPFMAKRY